MAWRGANSAEGLRFSVRMLRKCQYRAKNSLLCWIIHINFATVLLLKNVLETMHS